MKIKKEIAVIVARNENNEEVCFPAVEMEFNPSSNLVEYIMCPAEINKDLEKKAYEIALKTAQSFNSIGLLAGACTHTTPLSSILCSHHEASARPFAVALFSASCIFASNSAARSATRCDAHRVGYRYRCTWAVAARAPPASAHTIRVDTKSCRRRQRWPRRPRPGCKHVWLVWTAPGTSCVGHSPIRSLHTKK